MQIWLDLNKTKGSKLTNKEQEAIDKINKLEELGGVRSLQDRSLTEKDYKELMSIGINLK